MASSSESEKTDNKVNYLSNFTNLLKGGSEKLKEGFTKIFGDDSLTLNRKTLNERVKDNKSENKQIFSIHEDEEHKVYNYNIDDEDESDDMEEDDSNNTTSNDKSSDKGNGDLEKVESPKLEEDKSENRTNNISDSSPEFESEEEPDIHSISHRIFTTDSIVDLDGLSFVKCFKLKKKNKIFSYIGVSIISLFKIIL